jgi:hypothetical protein
MVCGDSSVLGSVVDEMKTFVELSVSTGPSFTLIFSASQSILQSMTQCFRIHYRFSDIDGSAITPSDSKPK